MRPRARKRFGQHFLEPAWVAKVIHAIDPRPDQTFIEIGPGRGALTLPLASRAASVVAYEIDRDLAAELQARVPPNVTTVEGDFLQLSRDLALGQPPLTNRVIRIAANLPYNVASPIVVRLVELYSGGLPAVDATLMLQREVADRLVAPPGTRAYGSLAVIVGHRATVTRLLNLPAGAFRPAPKVQSSLVRLQFHAPDPPVVDPQVFELLVTAVFTRRRKTLGNALLAMKGLVRDCAGAADATDSPDGRRKHLEALATAGISSTRRPETLSIREFARLADALAAPRRSCAIVRR